jgi:hypothetical protein
MATRGFPGLGAIRVKKNTLALQFYNATNFTVFGYLSSFISAL